MACLRIATGFVFLWALFYKLFGLGYVDRRVAPRPLHLRERHDRVDQPLIDYHVIYALALTVVAVTAAGNRWGLRPAGARLPFVGRHATVPS